MRLPFVKMHGLGNDFVVLDLRDGRTPPTPKQYAALADRREGIGCDQILLLEKPQNTRAAARYGIVNADGTPAEHCGNGVRCVARYLERLGEAQGQVLIEIGGQLFDLWLGDGTNVRVDMGVPEFVPSQIPIQAEHEASRYAVATAHGVFECGAVSMGNPHGVMEVEDTSTAEVAVLGPAIQASALFPAGVNVGFMQIVRPDMLRLRVFERGVGETRACGTGACAAVAIGRRWGRLGPSVDVELTGGHLTIEWAGEGQRLFMTGPTAYVYEGIIEL